MNFGEKLKDYRKKCNLTQEELALQLKTSQSAIHLYEEGKRNPSTSTVARVARLMELNAYELAELVKGVEFAKEPDAKYGGTDESEIEHAFELMKQNLTETERSFVTQVIYELVRNKNRTLDDIDENGAVTIEESVVEQVIKEENN